MPFKFDTLTSSDYYKEALIVYNAVNKLTTKDTLIARYWDCNPNVSFTAGHITYFQQQISPGGHWIHIAASVAEKEKFDMIKTAEVLFLKLPFRWLMPLSVAGKPNTFTKQ